MDQLKPEQQTQFSHLKTKLVDVGVKIKAIVEQGRLIANDTTQLFLFKGMYKELKPYFDSFNATWYKILELTVSCTTTVFPTQSDTNLQKNIERYYYESCAIYEQHMNPTPTAPLNSSTTARTGMNESRTVRARLPQINLPSFSGNQAEWPLFRDTYKSLIHEEPSLSNIEKFLFLVSCLKCSPLALIKGVELQEDNYPQAWKLLTDTYNDQRRLASGYLKTILEFVPFKSRPSANGLKKLLSTVVESIESFKQLGIPDGQDFLLLCLVLRCLDSDTRRNFEKKHSDDKFPTCKQLIDFIRVEWRSLELTTDETSQFNVKSGGNQNPKPQTPNRTGFQTSLLSDGSSPSSSFKGRSQGNASKFPHKSCPVCKNYHTIYQCSQFRKATPTERLNYLKGWTGCMNCLSAKHPSQDCTSQRTCQVCAKQHHTWLHVMQGKTGSSESAQQESSSTSGVALGSLNQHGEVLLGTALLEIKDSTGAFRKIRAVTDSGSQHSFITKGCTVRLGLHIEGCNQSVSGIGQLPLTGMVGKLDCHIRSKTKDFHAQPIVVQQITGHLPHIEVSSAIRARYGSYLLADEEFWKPKPIEFLLGGDLFYEIITGRPIQVAPDIPRLLPTIFGYIVGGPTKRALSDQSSSSLLVQSNGDMKTVMSRFWELEEVPEKHYISEEAKTCERHFSSTHFRLNSGRYVVSLPLRESIVNLVNPRPQALNRLLSLESKLQRNPTLREDYHKFMRDYIDLGHMKLAPPGTSAYTIPHHPVFKSQNGVDKLRVVFDASCSAGAGSLNEHMYTGPKLQLDISDVISNFRLHQLVFTADIVKMYRQILVSSCHRKYQHILWRFNQTEPIQDYELCTVTYGEKASAFLAQRTLKQLVYDDGSRHPLAARVLLEDIYVDDVATGAQTATKLIQLKDQLTALLDQGGFQLSKWASNCPELLSTLNDAELSESHVSLSDEVDARIKILGIQWDPNEDVFSYEIHPPPWNPTKRAILSAIARIYDPLGYIAPVVFYAKTILQAMWIAKIGWDDPGPVEVCEKWRKFLNELHVLSDVKLQRRLTTLEAENYQVVGFSDASQQGYAAVLYLQATTSTGHQVALLRAKTKLAPIKPTTIPRLELSGALLLSRLFSSCKPLLSKLNVIESSFFTDSQIVLGWLSTPPEELKTFVAHRVVEILENTNVNQWNFVQSSQNPADCSSRGTLPAEILDHHLWWKGPSWLSLQKCKWPAFHLESVVDLPETKRQGSEVTLTLITEDSAFLEWMERFSSYPKLIRTACYVIRFIKRARRQSAVNSPLTVLEHRNAEKTLIRIVQGRYKTSNGNLITCKSLTSLHPFIDGEGLVRVGGRLQHSHLPYDAKHPYILPSNCHLSKLLIDHYHNAYLHLGPATLQNILRSRYWITGARGMIRQRIFNCVKCYKFMKSPQAPVMGNLPACRLEEGQVFHNVGVDFAGPFFIKESLRRKAALGKAYLCLFICMSSRAVHLEAVSSCSTDAFLAAFTRFVARRGKPARMFSDCGTNFVGAANRLKEILLCLRSDESQKRIHDYASKLEIKWSFNPPSFPHFGGLWEAGVKSSKAILYKVMGESALTFEELSTLFCRVEGILNSRPLVPLGSDPEIIDCLTPGHFLIGRPLLAVPEEEIPQKVSPLRRWQLLQQKTQHFWARWRLEYLNTLQQRRKWKKEAHNLNVGDLVILKEPNSPLKSWPLARVVESHAGKDGVVRVATIRTSTGTYKRPVAKLVSLTPINEQM